MVVTQKISLQSRGNGDIIDITAEVQKQLSATKLKEGTVTLFITGSTAGITTIEHEPGLLADFKAMWERLAPKDIPYQHDKAWGDGNGHSHCRASLLGASLVVPFTGNSLMLGTWQQIVVVDFDNRARSRQIVVQVTGE
ncbi:MAG: secondary thiamine-phosphate synthase enzyme YjbQ [Dehalococcoidia bacterium]|jgi:secondary thiamine-phosphate synthase enzyme